MVDRPPRPTAPTRRSCAARSVLWHRPILFGVLPLAWLSMAAISAEETVLEKQIVAQASPAGADRAGDAVDSETPPPSNEVDARALVHRHLPELVRLLDALRRESPQQYRRAVADLARHAKRLENARRRDARLFEIELEVLKRQTRVDLLVAKLQLRDDAQMHGQLRRSLAGLQQARLARLTYDRDQAEQRLARAEQQLQAAEDRLQSARENAPAWVRQTYLHLLRKAGRDAETVEGDAGGAAADSASDKPETNEPETKRSEKSSSDPRSSQQREPQNSGISR